MAEVPKIVRERLQRASAGNHPDADTLTAFAERVLSDRERGTILDHLAGCQGCREIVAVALPFSEGTQTAIAYSPRPWLTWPALRWGFLTAGIALVASLGVVEYQRQSPQSMALYKVPVPSGAKNAAASVAAPAPAFEDSGKELDKTKTETRAFLTAAGVAANKSHQRDEVARSAIPALAPQPRSSATPALSLRRSISGPLSGGPSANLQMNQTNQWPQNTSASNAQAAAAPAAPPVNLANNGRSFQQLVETQPAPVQTAENVTVQSQSLSEQSPQGGMDESKVDRAKPLEAVVVGPSKAYAGPTPSAKLARSTSVAGARWTINPSGGLQRSLDQGATWQDVNVNASPAAASGISQTANDRTDRLESYAKKEKQASPSVFRAVAANGADVWAGGVNGVLYHSTDGGNRWTRVVPSSNAEMLTGDVVSVSFPDPQHGRIATSTSEAWVTADGGQSWEKK